MMFEAYTQKTQRMIYWKLEAAEMRALVNSCGAQRLKPTLEMPHLDLDSVLPTWAVTHCGFFFCVQICTKTYHSLQQVIWWLWMNLQWRYLRGGLVGKEICPQWELSGWLTLQTGHRQLDFHTRCLPFLYSADSINNTHLCRHLHEMLGPQLQMALGSWPWGPCTPSGEKKLENNRNVTWVET